MREKQKNPKRITSKKKQYDAEIMIKAVEHVRSENVSVHKTAKIYGVPEQTLRDRIKGHIGLDAKAGRKTILTHDEELVLVEHIEIMGRIAYGYTKAQISQMAAELAKNFGRKERGDKMSNDWVYGFLRRWKDRLSSLKPRSLTSTRAYHTTKEVVTDYYNELKKTLDSNNLLDKPHRIYNLDETGLNPEHRPPAVVAKAKSKPQAVTSPRTGTTTVIACGNAVGNSLPPYFVFKGKRLMPDLLKGSLPGTDATMTDSGWSNGEVLQNYLETHFLKYVPTGEEDPVLLMYDGHASHVTLPIIQWARCQPMDVSCFGPLKTIFYQECNLWMREHFGQVINRFNMCELTCKAYLKAMTPSNIIAGFRKTGIYPFNPDIVSEDTFMPSKAFVNEKGDHASSTARSHDTTTVTAGGDQMVLKFLENRLKERTKDNDEPVRKKVKFGGRAITDDSVVEELMERKSQKAESKATEKQGPGHSENSTINGHEQHQSSEPRPSTSGLLSSRPRVQEESDSDEDDVDEDPASNCCVCGKQQTPAAAKLTYITFINWGRCDNCGHWCHLRFCCSERVIRRLDTFLCPHCK